MQNKEELKKYLNGLTESMNGIIGMVEKTVKDSLEDLKKKDPEKAAEEAKKYAKAFEMGKLDEVVTELKKKTEGLNGIFNI